MFGCLLTSLIKDKDGQRHQREEQPHLIPSNRGLATKLIPIKIREMEFCAPPDPLGKEVVQSQLTSSATATPCVSKPLDSALKELPLGSSTG